MAVDTIQSLVEAVRQLQLLLPDQLTEVVKTLAGKHPDPKALAKELVQRGWLTPYQINQLFQGKGAGLVQGGYVLLDRLGEGGMGLVFRARQIKMGRVVALKLIRKDRLKNEQVARRFLREIEVAARLNHPNIVAALDADQEGDTIYFAMEYVDGEDLGKWVKSKGVLPPLQACDFICQAALGLQHAFEGNMIHRDIKPANLLVNRQGQVKILDLGLARIDQEDEEASALTQENSVMGTPDYIAPEQARDAHTVDIRADLYSLGCTLFYLLTGRVPFPGGTLTQKLLRHQLEPPPVLSTLRPDTPPEVIAVVTRLMHKRPEDRYQTPAELAQALSAIMTAPAPKILQATFAPAPQPFADLGAQETFPSSETPPATKRPLPAGPPWWVPYRDTTIAALRPLQKKSETLLGPWCEKVGIPRGKSWLIPPLAALLAIVLVFGLRGRNGPAAAPPSVPQPTGPVVKAPETVTPSALNALDAASIPAKEKLAWHPADLVAVVGEQQGHHPGGLTQLALSRDGKILASAGVEGNIRLWDPVSLLPVATLKSPKVQKFLGFAGASQRLFAACFDKTIRSWQVDGTRGRELPLMITDQGMLTALAVAEDGKTLASSGADQSIWLWDVDGDDARKRHVLDGLDAEISKLALSRDGKTLAAAANHERVYLWDLTESPPRKLPTIELAPRRVNVMTFSQDGLELYVGCNNTLHLFDIKGDRGEVARASINGFVHAIQATQDGRHLLASGQSITILERTGNDIKFLSAKSVHGQNFTGAFWMPDETTVISGLNDHTLRKWAVQGSKIEPSQPHTGHTREIVDFVFSASGKYLVTAGANQTGKVLLWNMQGAAPVLIRELATGTNAQTLAFSPNEKYLAGGGSQHPFIVVWETAQKDFGQAKVLQAYNKKGHASGIQSLAFSNKGNLLVSGGKGDICFWDFSAGIPKEPIHAEDVSENSSVMALAFAPNGQELASATWQGQVSLWNLAASPPSVKFKKDYALPSGHGRLAYTPDGQMLVGASKYNNRIRSLDSKTLQDMGDRFPNTPHGIFGLDVAAGINSLVSAERMGRVVVWDLQSERTRQWQLDSIVNQVRFAADGRHVGVAAGNVVYVLRLPH